MRHRTNPWRDFARAIQESALREQDKDFFRRKIGVLVNDLAELEIKPEMVDDAERRFWESHTVEEIKKEKGLTTGSILARCHAYGWTPRGGLYH